MSCIDAPLGVPEEPSWLISKYIHFEPIFHWWLTEPDVQTELLYRWVAQPEWAKTHKPPEPHSHLGPVCAVACTENANKMLIGHSSEWFGMREIEKRKLTWTMLCICGIRRSIRTSSSMTSARQTFFLTSESSSAASANRLYHATERRVRRETAVGQNHSQPP